MPIEFRCAKCSKLLRTPDGSAGKKGKCPHCGAMMDIPAASPSASALFDSPVASSPANPSDDLFGGVAPQAPTKPAQAAASIGQAPMQGTAGVAPNPYGGNVAPNPYGAPSAISQPNHGFGGGVRSHRGPMVLTFGIISLVLSIVGSPAFCCLCMGVFSVIGLGLGIPAWMMGNNDLVAMKNGTMDATGYGSTNAGWIMGIVGVVISSLGILSMLALVLIQVFMMSANSNF